MCHRQDPDATWFFYVKQAIRKFSKDPPANLGTDRRAGGRTVRNPPEGLLYIINQRVPEPRDTILIVANRFKEFRFRLLVESGPDHEMADRMP